MRLTTPALIGLGMMLTTMLSGQAAAEPKIYAYQAANFCPAGLQPITISGVICCGTPNRHVSYQSVMAHPAQTHRVRKIHRARAPQASCRAGTKGCDY